MKTKKKAVKKQTKLTAIEEKRVAVLKDALAQLKVEAFIAKAGNDYVKNYDLDDNIEKLCDVAEIISSKGKQVELQTYMGQLVSPAKPCDVCAKGAMFLSSIRKFNNLSLGDLSDGDTLDSLAHTKMQDLFGDDNADLIECYFEDGNPDHDSDPNDEGDEIEDPWMLLTDTQRLIRIFTNAIKNKGTFKPELEKF